MILVDANVWIDHFRRAEPALEKLLAEKQVLVHPFVLGEFARGSIGRRQRVLKEMTRLLSAVVATDEEVVASIEAERLFGRGIGYIDAHVLAAVRLTADTQLWTRDKRLRSIAADLGLAADLS